MTNILPYLYLSFSFTLTHHTHTHTHTQRPLHRLVPGGSRSLHQSHHTLLLWYYEHQVKNRYAQYLTILKVHISCKHLLCCIDESIIYQSLSAFTVSIIVLSNGG